MNEHEKLLPMNCSEFDAALDDLDRAGMPAMMLREAALEHAETCGRCAQRMNDTEALDFAFHQIATQDGDLTAPPRLEAALLHELRVQRVAQSRPKGNWRMAALATAAAVLLVLGFSLRHLSLNSSGGNIFSHHGQPALTADAQAHGGGTNSTNATTEVAENVSTDSEDATGFVSLPYATDPGTLQNGTVVRVELTRAALASMGMPVADVGSLDRIPADIMLSEDGAPQAIRLVSSTNSGQ